MIFMVQAFAFYGIVPCVAFRSSAEYELTEFEIEKVTRLFHLTFVIYFFVSCVTIFFLDFFSDKKRPKNQGRNDIQHISSIRFD